MQLCLIPPHGLEQVALRGSQHLVLAQIKHEQYANVYQQAWSRGDYLILDNGANEGEPVGDFALMARAAELGAREIVIPDVLGDMTETLRRARQFWSNLQEMTYPVTSYGYMAVVQGKTLDELLDCAYVYTHMKRVTTLGIPRHLISTIGPKSIRVTVAKTIYARYGHRFQIHFLGTNAEWPDEVLYASREVPFVRSVDTSMPFNYTLAGRALEVNATPVNRPDDYFTKWHVPDRTLLDMNISTIQRWTRGLR